MKKYEEYFREINRIEKDVIDKESEIIEAVAHRMALTLQMNKKLYLFGCGHSHILVEEAFYRAGGLVPVTPIFDTALMLHDGAVKSSQLEKMEAYGDWVFDKQDISKGDMLFIFSNSGINGCPIEMALRAKEKDAVVVAMTSRAYWKTGVSRHSSGKLLKDFADYIINTHVPYGDALIEVGDNKIAPGSTIIGAMIWNMLISQLSEECEKIGVQAEYFVSGNINGGAEINKQYIEKYRVKIRNL